MELEEARRSAWLVSDVSLSVLRSLDQYFVLRQASENPGSGQSGATSTVRLLDRQMSLDQFIQEADQAEKLREGEG